MEDKKLKEQVELIRQVFEYIHLFKGKIFVIKIDCALFAHPFFPGLIKDLVLLHRQGIRVVLVPGAKSQIDAVLEQYKVPWRSAAGIRISTPEAIPFIKMASFDVANKIMTRLAENNANGIIGNWVRARSIGVRDGVDFQNSGQVERINTNIIKSVLEEGLIPIFPNIGWNATGRPYNLSSNELAYSLACDLQARKLFFITDGRVIGAGDYSLPPGTGVSEGRVVTQLSLDGAARFLDLNDPRDDDELRELVSLASRAGQAGVERIHIVDGRIEGVLLKEIFSSRGFGTMIYADQHENIRPMTTRDIPEALRIMEPFMEKKLLVSRDEQTLASQCEDFVVYEVDGLVHATGALHLFGTGPGNTPLQGEIAAVAVDETYRGLSIGKRIVSYLQKRARSLGLAQVFALTVQAADWFLQLGFRDGGVTDLPPEKREAYNRDRNSRVLIYDLRAKDSPPAL
jgi:amino-acid N-acetyltransferase